MFITSSPACANMADDDTTEAFSALHSCTDNIFFFTWIFSSLFRTTLGKCKLGCCFLDECFFCSSIVALITYKVTRRTLVFKITQNCNYLWMQSPNVTRGWVKYLFFALVFSYQVERDCVESAGHDTEHAAEDERGHDVGKETDQAGAHAEHEVTHEVQRLQTDVRQQETLHV